MSDATKLRALVPDSNAFRQKLANAKGELDQAARSGRVSRSIEQQNQALRAPPKLIKVPR